ncbi:MAG: carboxypeptidase regulatory-like domain-containing protein [Myxococcota bacterium]
MKRLLSLAAGLALIACSGTPSGSDAGQDAGQQAPEEISVAGVVTMHPDSLALLADAGASTSVAGLTLRVEEPFKVALNNPDGVFHTQTLDAGGEFFAPLVPTELVTLGVAAGVRDDTGANRVIRSATTLYDVALMDGAKPAADITGGKGYAVPVELHQALNNAVGEANIRMLTGSTDAGTLIHAGFMLGKIVDASGSPVAGATVEPLGSSAAVKRARLFYPTADFSGTGAATAAHGLFVYVHNGGDVDTFQFRVTGKAEYKQRNAGAAKDACLVLTVFPGTAMP